MKSLTNWPVMVNHTLLPICSTHRTMSSQFQVLWDSSQRLANLSSKSSHFSLKVHRALVKDGCHGEIARSFLSVHWKD